MEKIRMFMLLFMGHSLFMSLIFLVIRHNDQSEICLHVAGCYGFIWAVMWSFKETI